MLNLMEMLRPFVGSKGWDYCAVWRINEEQSLLECIACCCAGAEAGNFNERNDLMFSASSRFSCKDVVVQHQRTKFCELLSQLPSSVPLDCGIYAEAFFSSQPRWLHTLTDPDPNKADTEELPATRVLIPVLRQLVELFVAKQVPEDQTVVDFIISQCVVPLELGALVNSDTEEEMAHLGFGASNYTFHHKEDSINQQTTSLQKMNSVSNPRAAANNGSDMPSQNADSVGLRPEAGRSDSHSDSSYPLDDGNDSKSLKTSGKGPAKNLDAERKRRKKLNERLYKLRTLVPIISKLDKAHILVDAIEYVKQLRKQEQELKEELEQDTDNDGMDDLVGEFGNQVHKNAPNQFVPRSCGVDIDSEKVQQMEPQVDVTLMDRSKFVIRVFCEHKPGGFFKLLEALHSLGLEVVNVNVTSCRMLVSNVFQVEMKGETNQVVADELKNSLLELTRVPSRAPLPPLGERSNKSDNGFGMHYHYDHQHHFLGHHTSLYH